MSDESKKRWSERVRVKIGTGPSSGEVRSFFWFRNELEKQREAERAYNSPEAVAERRAAESIETQRGIAEATRQSADEARAARDSAALSTTLTAIAAGAAIFALLTSLAAYRLAFSDDEHDRRWRAEQRHLATEQLRALETIRDRLTAATP